MCSSLRCSGSQSVSHTINALISGTQHHKVSIHYAWVASARSPSWTFSADWRSCVDSQVLFKAHLYVRALLRLRRCYIPTLEGLKWAPLSPRSAQGRKKEGDWSATSDTWSASLSRKSDGRVMDRDPRGPQPVWVMLQKFEHVKRSVEEHLGFFDNLSSHGTGWFQTRRLCWWSCYRTLQSHCETLTRTEGELWQLCVWRELKWHKLFLRVKWWNQESILFKCGMENKLNFSSFPGR